MPAKTSTPASVRTNNILFIFPQLLVLVLIIVAMDYAGVKDPILYGGALFFVLFILLKAFLLGEYRKGLRSYKNKKYSDAIDRFSNSYSFFKENTWVDNLRFVTLFSTSRPCYRELSLLNIALSYAQMNDWKKAREYYARTLKEFPASQFAKECAQYFDSGKSGKS